MRYLCIMLFLVYCVVDFSQKSAKVGGKVGPTTVLEISVTMLHGKRNPTPLPELEQVNSTSVNELYVFRYIFFISFREQSRNHDLRRGQNECRSVIIVPGLNIAVFLTAVLALITK